MQGVVETPDCDNRGAKASGLPSRAKPPDYFFLIAVFDRFGDLPSKRLAGPHTCLGCGLVPAQLETL